SDLDGDTLTYRITQNPALGTLSGTAPHLTYTPNANANGTDSFKFVVNDGTVDSAAATVTINIVAHNDEPHLTSVATLTAALEDTPFAISYNSLAAASDEADVDNSSIVFRVEAISSGTLTKAGQIVAPGSLVNVGDVLEWTPDANANGTLTAFTIKAWD